MNEIGILLFFFCTLLPLFHMFHALPMFGPPKKRRRPKVKEQGMSIIIPCYNENRILETTLKGLQQVDYKNKEVIFVNDGSTDDTLDVLDQLLDIVPIEYEGELPIEHKPILGIYQSRIDPNIYVIDKVNGGKADALNAGCNFAQHEIIVTLDADSILDKQALKEVNLAFYRKEVVAAGGMVHILQGKSMKDLLINQKKWLVRLQIFEYLKGFYIYKSSLARLNALAIISGAFGVFRRSILVHDLKGYRETLGEDIDITLRFQQWILKHPGSKMLFIPEAVCYTECPESWRDLFKQRVRWQKAFVDCVLYYWRFLVKTVFTHAVSFFFLFDAFFMGTVATMITTAVFIALLLVPNTDIIQNLTAYLIGSIVLNFIYNLYTLYISYHHGVSFQGGSQFRLLLLLFIDVLFYRFVILFYILYGTFAYAFNSKDWSKVARSGRQYELNVPMENG